MRTCETAVESHWTSLTRGPMPGEIVECAKPAPHVVSDGRKQWWCCDAHASEHESDGLDVERDQ